jgi:hypothetical protein
MKQLFFLIFALVAMFMGLSLCSKSPPPPTTSSLSDEKSFDAKSLDEKPFDQKLFQDQVMQSLGPSPASWRAIRFEESIGKDFFRLMLLYQSTPSGLPQVENDTKRIARAVLKA